MVPGVDRCYAVPVYISSSFALLAACDRLSLCYGLVGNQPLLSSLLLFLQSGVRGALSLAHSEPILAYAALTALPVRSAALVPPVLAGGAALSFRGSHCSSVDKPA